MFNLFYVLFSSFRLLCLDRKYIVDGCCHEPTIHELTFYASCFHQPTINDFRNMSFIFLLSSEASLFLLNF